MIKALHWIFLALIATLQTNAQAPFILKDSNPNSEAFRKRFLASYGINEAIEPKLDPKDRDLYHKALPYLQDNPQEAIRLVEEGLSDDEEKPAFQFLLGNLYYRLENFAQSERALSRAIKAFPSFRRAYRTLGLIYIQSENFPKAAEAWRNVIALGGGDAQSYGLLAYSQLSREKFASALSAYQMALMFNPDSRDFRRGQAHCLLALDKNKEALGLLDELIEEQPGETDFWLMQANLFLKMSRYQDAIANLEIVRILDKVDPQGLRLLGDLYLQEELPTHALEAFTSALQKTTNFEKADAWILPLRTFTNRVHLSEARQYLSSLKQTLPASALSKHSETLTVAEAALAMESDDAEKTLQLLTPVVKLNPMQGEALLLVGRAYQQQSKLEEAAFHFERARSIPDSKEEALVALGRLKIAQGKIEDSLPFFREAHKLNPREALGNYIKRLEAFVQ